MNIPFNLVLVFLLVLSSLSAQKTKGTLFFKDGIVKKGLVRLTGSGKIKYKSSKKAKATKYDFSEFEKVDILENKETVVYVHILARGHNGPQVVRELVKGKVSLYHLLSTGGGPVFMPGNGPGGGSYTHNRTYDIKHLYVKRKGENVATHLGSDQLFTKNFKKAASRFFKDCTSLVQKIENRAYKKRDIKEIVAFYNNECK